MGGIYIADNSLQECLLLLNTGTTHLTSRDMLQEVNMMFGNSNANSPNNAATFLPLINNERAVKSSTLREGLARLKLFAMVMWRNDTTVKPKESSHFQFFYPDQVGSLKGSLNVHQNL